MSSVKSEKTICPACRKHIVSSDFGRANAHCGQDNNQNTKTNYYSNIASTKTTKVTQETQQNTHVQRRKTWLDETH